MLYFYMLYIFGRASPALESGEFPLLALPSPVSFFLFGMSNESSSSYNGALGLPLELLESILVDVLGQVSTSWRSNDFGPCRPITIMIHSGKRRTERKMLADPRPLSVH